MASIFTKIINREIPAHIVAEDEDFIAFLDINPNAIGHTLCVPKKEVDKLLDLDDDTYVQLMQFAKKVGLGIRKSINCKRVGMSVVGLEVPHVHVHLIPLNKMSEMTFQKKVKMQDDELKEVAHKIADAIK
jgi:histidine triad (HIT) family protein